MALAFDISSGSTAEPAGGPRWSGLAMTLRETERGTRVRIQMRDGSEVAGTIDAVNGETVALGGPGGTVELGQVRRIVLEFGAAPKRRAA